MEIAMIGEKIVELAELEPAFMDRGTYFGDGVYEVVRSYKGRLFVLDEHLERLSEGGVVPWRSSTSTSGSSGGRQTHS